SLWRIVGLRRCEPLACPRITACSTQKTSRNADNKTVGANPGRLFFWLARCWLFSRLKHWACGEIEAVGVHHLSPSRREVLRELLFRVGARIDLGEGAKLRVRTEDQIDTRGGPLQVFGLAIAALID